MIKDENYYTVQGWMRTRLHLKGNDLHVYAMLYSFSQDGQSEFRGSLDYMSEFTGGSERNIKRSLSRLEKYGLIEKEDYHSKTGRTNGFKCVPLDKLNLQKVGQDKMSYPIGQNVPSDDDKMSYPTGQNVPSIPYINTDNQDSILKAYKKERKKIKKENLTACAREKPDFSKMTETELVVWGEEHTVDFSDEESVEIFERFIEETEKRASKPSWVGKIIKQEGQYVRMKSHVEIIKESGCGIALRESLCDWLRACYANGHLVTNRQLEDTIFSLQEKYGDDERAMSESILRAADSGYIRIVV